MTGREWKRVTRKWKTNGVTIMRNKIYIVVVIVVVTIFTAEGFGRDNPYTRPIGSPPGAATLPPSSYTRGPVNSTPGNYNVDGNLIITGNVSGGKHFRGFVPYNSTSQLDIDDSDFGLSSLNSFIRRSAGYSYFDRSPGLIQPYYLPSQTVTSLIRSGQPGLSAPQITFPGGTGGFALRQSWPQTDIYSLQSQPRPLSMEMEDIERVIAEQLGLDELRRQGIEEPYRQFDITRQIGGKLFPESLQLPQLPELGTQPQITNLEERLAEEMSRQLLDEYTFEKTNELDKIRDSQLGNGYKPDITNILEPLQELSPDDIDHARAEAIRGEHKTFEEYTKAKFDEYMQAAEEFIKQGKYYRAADAYTLASLFDSTSAKALVGRAHTLFAAGEYMSSAFFLKKAIVSSPDFLKKKGLVDSLKDRDMIENRLFDKQNGLIRWQMQSKSPELAFLLAYVFYNKDNFADAGRAIDFAAQQMPDSPEVKTLQKAIKDAANTVE